MRASSCEPAACAGFNKAPDIGIFIDCLKKDYEIDVAIETGTCRGDTARFLCSSFNEVHTMEISSDYFQEARTALQDCPNAHCYLGSSEKVLAQILPSLKDRRAIFYLDAHWNDYWPLLDELNEISKTHRDNCIIVIDDFKVPGRREISYDQYGSHSCSYKYIKEELSKLYTHYDFYYLIPKNIASRAKFIAIPRAWQKKQDRLCKSNFDIVNNLTKLMTQKTR